MTIRISHVASALIASALVAVSLWPRPASACEPGFCIDRVSPTDGATDVPKDANIWVYFNGGPPPNLTLNTDGGESVSLQTRTFPTGYRPNGVSSAVMEVSPHETLEESATYQLSIDGSSACGTPDDVSFTTGNSEVPTDRFSSISIDHELRCQTAPERPTSCTNLGRFPAYQFELGGAQDVDAFGLKVRHRETDSIVAFRMNFPLTFTIRSDSVGDTECFVVEAVNRAGEREFTSSEICVDTTQVSCGTDGGDTGVSDTGAALDTGADASTRDAGPDTTTADSAASPGNTNSTSARWVGCGCTQSGSVPGSLFSFGLLLLFVSWVSRLSS